jgi:succinoglycan biosynthesis transport protein ExoP
MKSVAAREEGDLRSILRKVGRHKIIVIGSLLIGLGAAWAVRHYSVPRYEAEAQVVLEIRSARIVKFDEVLSDLPSQPGVLRTEMDVITSRAMAERVASRLTEADKHRLADISAMTPPLQRLAGAAYSALLTIGSWAGLERRPAADAEASTPAVGEGTPLRDEPLEHDELIKLLMSEVRASNDGQSLTIHISYSSADAELAAAVANLYARAYISNQIDLKADVAARASAWLRDRLVELRSDLQASETAVQQYRRAADILEDKQGTVTAQQLGEINSQLVRARSARLEAASRLDALKSLATQGDDIESLSDVMSSPVVQNLRERQAELKRKQAVNEGRYTRLYPADESLTDLATIQREIDAEVQRVAQNLASKVEIARSKERALETELARLEHRFGQGRDAEVQLRQLQRESDANRAVYEAYLARIKEITEQGKLQEPDSYLISSAIPPEKPSYPRTVPLLALGAVFGALAGVALALLRELFEHRLHTIEDVEEVTGLRVLALLPALPYPRFFKPENYVLRHPRSLFNEALRTARAAIALSREGEPSNVILVTSSIPNEGKTAFCLSLARSLATDGRKVLLIDADLRRPGVARALGGKVDANLAEILIGNRELSDVIRIDKRSGAHYIAARDDAPNPQDVLNSWRMEALIADARAEYDTVIIDAPPILLVADAAIIAKWADQCLFVVRWGSTARDYVAHALRRLELYRVTMSGVILSHVNTRRHANYASGEGYYRSYVSRPTWSWRTGRAVTDDRAHADTVLPRPPRLA